VVLITGSGPQDRNESLMGHEPFGVLADYLTRQGIAVLRCDDRGVGKSKGNFATSTTADFTNDVRSMLAWLRACPKVDAKRMGLIGHSEGGIIAPLVASKEDDIAFMVLLAGVGVPMKDLSLRQIVDVTRSATSDQKTIAAAEARGRELIALLMEDTDTATLGKRIREKIMAAYNELTPEERAKSGDPETAITMIMLKVGSPWQRWIIRYDPAPALRAVKCPVLAINGKKDIQVAWKENLEAIARDLDAGGNTHVKIAALPDLNHLFQHCKTGSLTEYGEIEETMSPAVLKQVGDWIHAQLKP
jgi:pimeloyl-ACP methyl ester carboxylesterase